MDFQKTTHLDSIILIAAHSPLASALRECALHVFPDCASFVLALDVKANDQPETSLEQLQAIWKSTQAQFQTVRCLVLTDIQGATPCNVAQKWIALEQAKLTTIQNTMPIRLIAGVNLPMLLRAICYRQEENIDNWAECAVSGAHKGIISISL